MPDEALSQEERDELIKQSEQDGSDAPQAGGVPNGEQKPDTSAAAANGTEADRAVRSADFSPVNIADTSPSQYGVDLIMDVQLCVAVELGRAKMRVKDVLAMGPGSVLELEKAAGEPVEVVVNNKVIARGEVVVVDDNFGVRVTEIVGSTERGINAKAA